MLRNRIAYVVAVLVLALAGCKKDVPATKEGPAPVGKKAEEPMPSAEVKERSDVTSPDSKPPEEQSPREEQQSPREEQQSPIEIGVVHTNDVHGYILPYVANLAVDREGKKRYLAEIGGVEWLLGYVEILRSKLDGRVLLLDAGDMFQGTMISNRFEGATVVKAMNHMGYAAAAVGNHEFDFGPEGEGEEGDAYGALRARAKEAAFPFLSANLLDRTTGRPLEWEGFAPYVLVDMKGIKVGIVGGPTTDTPTYSKKRVGEGLEFQPLAGAIQKYVPELREKGAQVIIGLIHAGGKCEEIDNPQDISSCDMDEEMFKVAQALPPGTVDLLIGGHSHAVVAHYVNGTPVVEAGSKGRLFGLVKLRFDPAQGKVVEVVLDRPVGICHHHFVDGDDCVFLEEVPGPEKKPATFLGEEVKPVVFFEALLTEEQRQVMVESQEKLGPTAVRDVARTEPGTDLPMGLLLTHVLLEKYPQADIALFNESGIRADLSAGEITREDVFRVLPFDSGPAFIRIRGDKLLDLLRLACSGAHGAPVVRGLRLVIDRKADECIAEDWDGNGEREKW